MADGSYMGLEREQQKAAALIKIAHQLERIADSLDKIRK